MREGSGQLVFWNGTESAGRTRYSVRRPVFRPLRSVPSAHALGRLLPDHWHWLIAPDAVVSLPRKPIHDPGPFADLRTIAAEPFGGCWPGTYTSNA